MNFNQFTHTDFNKNAGLDIKCVDLPYPSFLNYDELKCIKTPRKQSILKRLEPRANILQKQFLNIAGFMPPATK